MRKLILALLLLAAPAFAQYREVKVNNTVGSPVNVTCVSGCAAGASVLMADAMSNPTIPQTAVFPMFYNGATWDRFRGSIAGGLLVDVSDATIAVTQSGAWSNRVTDGTDTALVSGTGSLQVTCDNCGGSTFADNSAFTFGTSTVLNIGAVVDDTAPNAVAENSAGNPRMSSNRVLYGQVRDASGSERGANVNASNALLVAQTGELPAGTQNIGDVDVVTLPSVTIGTFPDNEPFNVAQINGITPLMGNGITGTGSQRVTVASDNTPFPIKFDQTTTSNDVDVTTLPSVTIGTFPDNEPVNVAQMNGVAVTMGNGISGTGVQRVTIASDSTGQVAVASLPNEGQQTAANSISVTPDTDNDAIGVSAAAPPGEYVAVGGLASGATGGFLYPPTVCDSFANVNISTATTTLIVTGVSGRHVRICAVSLIAAAADNVALISGTGATCGTGTTGMTGGTTAATGYNFAANGGIAQGAGVGEINRTNATGDSVCIVTSAAVQLSGRISYAIY